MSYTMHGFAWRVFDVTASTDQDMYISYNARNFEYKRDAFSGDSRVRVLVLGNSFGRDIVNVIRETYDFDAIDLVYRDDFSNLDILDSSMGSLLFNDADLIIFANIDGGADIHSVRHLLDAASKNNHRVVFIGSKHFGYNLDWITRIDRDKRGLLRNPLLDGVLHSEENVKRLQLPSLNYISIIHALCDGNGDILITDELGRLISPDRVHLTKYGAIYIGQHVFLSSILSDLLPRKSCQF